MFIITKHSGFGRTAAFWSKHLDSIYSIDYKPGDTTPPPMRKCAVDDVDRVDDVASAWSRI